MRNDSGEYEKRDSQLHRSIEREELFMSNPGIDIDSVAPQDLIQNMRIPMSSEVKNEVKHTPRERAIFDAGFECCRTYGDNFIHYKGEQADRLFSRQMEA